MNGFLIAGTASGVGKTTVTLAVIAAMRRRGVAVQPFKGGPDFLDAGHLTRIAGRTARNLDIWMLPPSANLDVLREAAHRADAVVVEGMMGLFDGKDGVAETGSSAEIAKLLQLPVILVLDAAKSARSIAAVVLGFERFDPALRLAGVILNRVASERHYAMLRTAIDTHCRTRVLGWLPRAREIAIPERHLGLRTVEEESNDREDLACQLDHLASLAEAHLDMNALSSLQCGLQLELVPPARLPREDASIRIGVAQDQAFSFYYEDNLDLLREQGAEIIPFSPLHDEALPQDLDALYLGGGYPELYASQLSTNETMLRSMQTFAASGKPLYAECGGMIYLSKELLSTDGTAYPMAAVLPFSMEMTNRLSKFGYVTVELTRDCILGVRGSVLRGHSFHYSRIRDTPTLCTSYRVSYSLASQQQEEEGFTLGSLLASYIHVHFRTAPHIARHFVQVTRLFRAKELVIA